MIEYIEAHPADSEKNAIIRTQIGSLLKETDTKVCTESEAPATLTFAVPIDSKTSLPIAVKYYKHVCNHDIPNGKGCQLVEIIYEGSIEEKEIIKTH
jgi:hypothetical protein